MKTILLFFTLGIFCIHADVDPKKNWTKKDNVDGRWNKTDVGPFLSCIIRTPIGVIAKGLAVRVGPADNTVAYDLQSGTVRVVSQGGFLKFSSYKFGIASPPSLTGKIIPWCSQDGWNGAVTYKGFHQHGKRVILEYKVDKVKVYDSPGLDAHGETVLFTRSLHLEPHSKTIRLRLSDQKVGFSKRIQLAETSKAHIHYNSDGIILEIPASKEPVTLTLAYLSARGECSFKTNPDFTELRKPAATIWPDLLPVKSTLGIDKKAYTIDTIGIPFENPYRALMYISGHDFFSDGTMAASTLHGDVWLIRGVDDKLKKVTWQRFATGLHQPFGVKIVNDQIYVLGRDQITRLHDTNKDGAADFYENFNNMGETSTNGHDYAAGLEIDAEGNFYYIRAHEGVVKVSPDGSSSRSVATGFRNPIGIGVSNKGVITAAPQEGNWTPASSIIEVKEGNYYGYAGPRYSKDRPLGYDTPLCWLPRIQDNSSGGQVWVESDRWGPLKDRLLHLSYGLCRIMLVMREEVAGTVQGGTVWLPLNFNSGVIQGCFSPHDGQLYVSGLRGWQTNAAKDGCLQRVRYTGKTLFLPVALETQTDGVILRYSTLLDKELAEDTNSFSIAQWNYKYSSEYGSNEYKVSNPNELGHDNLKVKSAKLLEDGKSIYLVIENMQPAMQMQIKYDVESTAGDIIIGSIYNTIHRLPNKKISKISK